jgi:hypothetical protein
VARQVHVSCTIKVCQLAPCIPAVGSHPLPLPTTCSAALLNYAHMRLRSKARFLDEMQDSLQVVQHNYNTLVAAHPEVAAGMPPEACDKREPEAAGPGNNEKQQLLSDMARMEQRCVSCLAQDTCGSWCCLHVHGSSAHVLPISCACCLSPAVLPASERALMGQRRT